MKEKFYIFLDIDGVLNAMNAEELKSDDHVGYYEDDEEKSIIGMYKSRVNLFKRIYETISMKFDVEIIITSSWRVGDVGLVNTNECLVRTGFDISEFNKTLDSTEITRGDRGQEILDKMVEIGINKDSNRYIVLDDETFDIKDYIDSSRIVKPHHTTGLTEDLAVEFINKAFNNEDKSKIYNVKQHRSQKINMNSSMKEFLNTHHPEVEDTDWVELIETSRLELNNTWKHQ